MTPRTFLVASSSKWRCGIVESWLPSNPLVSELVVASISPDIDEKAIRHPLPETLCVSIGRAKLEAVLQALKGGRGSVQLADVEYIVAGDQLAVYRPQGGPFEYDAHLGRLVVVDPQPDGTCRRCPLTEDSPFEVREKPESAEECMAFLGSYSGRFVQTVASVVLHHVPTGRTIHTVDVNTVHFSHIPRETMDAIIFKDGKPTGDCMSCCGGFVVEDPNLARSVMRIDGCMEGVQGMNPAKLNELLTQLNM